MNPGQVIYLPIYSFIYLFIIIIMPLAQELHRYIYIYIQIQTHAIQTDKQINDIKLKNIKISILYLHFF